MSIIRDTSVNFNQQSLSFMGKNEPVTVYHTDVEL